MEWANTIAELQRVNVLLQQNHSGWSRMNKTNKQWTYQRVYKCS